MKRVNECRLQRGDLPPSVITSLPGPRSVELSQQLAAHEAPGINTLYQGQPALQWEEALGSNVLDVDGNRFIDLTAGFGVASVGHRHPDVVDAVKQQSDRLLHGLGDVAAHPPRIELARRLAHLAPMRNAQVYFAVSGADAVEIALKTAYLATQKPGFVVFEPSYHGLTLGALTATSRAAFRHPFRKHVHQHAERLPFACDPKELQDLLKDRATLGAVLLEPIVGREGILIPPIDWLTDLRRITAEQGVLLIVDEIFTGFGRTGALFAVNHDEIEPDLLCCGKALGGGLPIGAVLGRSDLLQAWKTSGEALHTATFVGHPLACAAGQVVLDLLQTQQLPERAARLGQDIGERLQIWQERFTIIHEVRGRGLMWGLDFATAEKAQRLVQYALREGLILLAGGARGTVAQIVPPLTIDRNQLFLAVDILEHALSQLDPS